MWPVMEPVGKLGMSCEGTERASCPPARYQRDPEGAVIAVLLPPRSPPFLGCVVAEGPGGFLGSRRDGAALHPLTSMQTFPWTPVWAGSSLA